MLIPKNSSNFGDLKIVHNLFNNAINYILIGM